MEAAVKERLVRMRGRSVDVLQVQTHLLTLISSLQNSAFIDFSALYQFHWQDYNDKGYLEALRHLRDLQSEGVIKAIGLCNFDSIRTDEICTHLGTGAIVSNQVQVRNRATPFRFINMFTFVSIPCSFLSLILDPCTEWVMFVRSMELNFLHMGPW